MNKEKNKKVDDTISSSTADENARSPGFWQQLTRSPAQIWKSHISWRITLTVFITILFVQMGVLIFTVRNFEAEKTNELRGIARAVIASSVSGGKDQMTSPVTREKAGGIFSQGTILGFAIYGLDRSMIQPFGETVLLAPKSSFNDSQSYKTDDNRENFEVVYTPIEIGAPYYVAVRLDTSSIAPLVRDHIRQTILILLLMSAFVTSVLMLALGEWLLEPMILLRNNLLSAAKNPEKPDVRRLKKDSRDEISVAIRIANDLIRQNASNLQRLRTQAEGRIHKLAYYDTLTGLPNRTFFLEKLDDHVKNRVIDENRRIAVLSVDIDHFKDINDTMGHEIGDRLLEAIGKRLVKAIPEDAIVARASADEFTIMATLKPGETSGESIVNSIFSAMIEPVSIAQEEFQVRVSVGVSHCPEDGMEARQILKNADIALNRAKEEGRDCVRYYSQDFDRAVQKRFQMLRSLRSAMDENQLQLHFHPQFDLRNGRMIGAEALLRWWRPDNSKEGGSFVSPVEFIPVAEQSGLIVPIGEWVLRKACETNRAWQEKGLPPIRIAVNISGVQFHRGELVQQVAAVLKDTKLDPHFLELEVTESIFMENMQGAIDILNQLHRLGVELAMDDFGTGYSSLSYLRQFPIDRLKIDQSFIRNALINPDDRMIAKTIINLGHSLNLKVIAEGVETNDHEYFLKEEGCDEAQGFKYTKPLPADKFWDFAVAYNRNLAKSSKLSVVEETPKSA